MSTWYALQQHKTYITGKIIPNQFCNVKNYYIIGEINPKKIKLCNVIILAPMVKPISWTYILWTSRLL